MNAHRTFIDTFSLQADILKRKYLGHIPILSTTHGGTEALHGINLDVMSDDVIYTFMTLANFFEFIPEMDIDESNPTTVLAHQVY